MAEEMKLSSITKLHNTDLQKLQADSPYISKVRSYRSNGKKPTQHQCKSDPVQVRKLVSGGGGGAHKFHIWSGGGGSQKSYPYFGGVGGGCQKSVWVLNIYLTPPPYINNEHSLNSLV